MSYLQLGFVRWGWSVVDLKYHVVDQLGEHSWGAYRAECGHLLSGTTPLHDQPYGSVCAKCADVQFDRARPPAEEQR